MICRQEGRSLLTIIGEIVVAAFLEEDSWGQSCRLVIGFGVVVDMNHTSAKEGDLGVDLEAGVVGSWEEVRLTRDPVSDVESQRGLCPSVTVKGSGTTETLSSAEKVGKEKRKKSSDKKASKPPRPPRAPLLNATDQKLMKEIAEYAMLKRARMERMKALKKEKNAKAASASSGNAIAMVFTVLFIFIILFQGCSPSTKPSVNNFEGSPESAGFLNKDPISVHYGPIPLASYNNRPSFGTPSSTEQVVDERLLHES